MKSLHFMMMKYDLTKHPGQWRPGAVWVEDENGGVVYTAPPRDDLEALVAEALKASSDASLHTVVRAAMAHLNLTLIHPFSDGNARMARCLQSYVLAGDGFLSPEFLSIEEYLGRNTKAYYGALTEVAHGEWSPRRSVAPWIRFCLTAHYRQAHTVLRRIEETEALWDACEQLVRRRRLPERSVPALCDAARGWRLQRSLYMKTIRAASGEEMSEDSGTRDLRAPADAGLLVAVGERRGRTYVAGDELRALWDGVRSQRRPHRVPDPYDTAQPTLPGMA